MPKFPVTCRVQRRFRSGHVIVQKGLAAAGAAQTRCTVIRALCNGSSGMATCVVACKWQVIKLFSHFKSNQIPGQCEWIAIQCRLKKKNVFKCFCFVLSSYIVESTVHISKRPCEYAEYSRLVKAFVKPCASLLTQRVGANRNSACRYVFHHCALGNAEFSVWRCWRFHAGSSC